MKASDYFTPEEITRIQTIIKLFNGRVIAIYDKGEKIT